MSDASALGAQDHHTPAQQAGLNNLHQLFRQNEQDGWRQYFSNNPMEEQMQASLQNAVSTAQYFIETGVQLRDARAVYFEESRRSQSDDPESVPGYQEYAAASAAHDAATEQWISYGTDFHNQVRTAMDSRNQDAIGMAQMNNVDVAYTLAYLNSNDPQGFQQWIQGANRNAGAANRGNDNRRNDNGTNQHRGHGNGHGNGHGGANTGGRSNRRTR
ncbi:hypothetical protein ACIQNU_37475 [Streptomyces sp. NPDC091292]|uniref:hypothetical protein n=1 Tax=Streptomyces sp. NPDC091292 TaxID=3365991 RepID=UPI00380D7740